MEADYIGKFGRQEIKREVEIDIIGDSYKFIRGQLFGIDKVCFVRSCGDFCAISAKKFKSGGG